MSITAKEARELAIAGHEAEMQKCKDEAVSAIRGACAHGKMTTDLVVSRMYTDQLKEYLGDLGFDVDYAQYNHSMLHVRWDVLQG